MYLPSATLFQVTGPRETLRVELGSGHPLAIRVASGAGTFRLSFLQVSPTQYTRIFLHP